MVWMAWGGLLVLVAAHLSPDPQIPNSIRGSSHSEEDDFFRDGDEPRRPPVPISISNGVSNGTAGQSKVPDLSGANSTLVPTNSSNTTTHTLVQPIPEQVVVNRAPEPVSPVQYSVPEPAPVQYMPGSITPSLYPGLAQAEIDPRFLTAQQLPGFPVQQEQLPAQQLQVPMQLPVNYMQQAGQQRDQPLTPSNAMPLFGQAVFPNTFQSATSTDPFDNHEPGHFTQTTMTTNAGLDTGLKGPSDSSSDSSNSSSDSSDSSGDSSGESSDSSGASSNSSKSSGSSSDSSGSSATSSTDSSDSSSGSSDSLPSSSSSGSSDSSNTQSIEDGGPSVSSSGSVVASVALPALMGGV